MSGDGAASGSGSDDFPRRLEDQIAQAVAILGQGGVVAFPTDTVYGYAASLRHPSAIARIYAIKGRPEAKAIPILLSSPETLSTVASEIDPATRSFAERWWPGALTIIVNARPGLPSETITRNFSGEPTIALRVPDNNVATRIIADAGGALAVTSANRSGEDPALSAHDLQHMGAEQPDLIVDGGECPLGLPSTIVSITASTLQILREGAIPVAELANFANSLGLAVETTMPGTV